jgi:site-specific DNA-cytosine methylase
MIFPMLKIIEERMFSIALIENVEAFANSTECALFEEKLRALGYKVETIVHNALDFNGYSSRKRAFVFATVLDVEYEQPEKVEKRTAHFWNDIIQPNLGSHAGGTNNKENSTTTEHFRNVSHTGGIKTYIAGLKLSKKCKNSLNETQKKQVVKFQRANVRTEKSAHCGTLLKSQSRQVAESLYVKVGDEYLLPDNDICKMVMGIPQNFDVSMLSKELGNEVIGQSVDFFMHRAIGKKIKKHIDDYLISIGQQVKGITKVFENIY